ncbi:MAG: UDP-N-acetylglucosamine--N-acetylmuramyl-(pentapeptide) pyrophosphoryl-undecaprenol N-acetylglucosamine transferase [Phycisphaerae bacterium]|nr:UDP-N-acetylglucosamine--N-acetylmuramyl-(pentapeptide) pyrophosphoryl-undecaprenol N-acetylglucosamine transferase [Phycisphaerae bacterium]
MTGALYILAGGGTGGHLYPGLAVAEALRRAEPAGQIVFACSDRSLDERILAPRADLGVVRQPVRPLPRRAGEVPGFLRAWRASRRLAGEMLADLRPAAVLGLGGFAAGPVVREAARRGVRAALLNPDAVPGRANRYLARRAEAIFAGFPAAAECFPAPARGKVRAVGCPLRAGIAAGRRDEAMAHFGLDADRRTLVVLGGSSGAASVNAVVAALGDALTQRAGQWQVLHVTGPRRAGLADAYPPPDAPIFARHYCERMDLAYAAADVVLCRAGAVTVAELAATSTPAVLMPYPHHRDRQQHHNAAELVTSGGAVICEDAVDAAVNADRLGAVLLGLLDDEARRRSMREAAGRCDRPGAADIVAAWLSGA